MSKEAADTDITLDTDPARDLAEMHRMTVYLREESDRLGHPFMAYLYAMAVEELRLILSRVTTTRVSADRD